MKKTLIVISSNRGWARELEQSLEAMQSAGAILLEEYGSPCVCFARCRALSMACETLRSFADRDVVLMVDDDMQIPLATAQLVVDEARERGEACSAIYATQSRTIAAEQRKDGRWMTGCGTLAIPRHMLLELEQRSPSFEMRGKAYTAFTSTGARNGRWMGEDFTLCDNLGGVHLLPAAVGHVKPVPLWPDDETLARIGLRIAESQTNKRGDQQ